jgi:UDP-glucose 4-epimerase
MKKRILITGIYGFLGSHVARLAVASGHRVTGIDSGKIPSHLPPSDDSLAYHTAEVTLFNLKNLNQTFDCIFHCAGTGVVGLSLEKPLADFESNLSTTAHVLEYIRTSNRGAKLVLPSSLAVYGNQHDLPLRTSATPAPISPYGYHKKMAEEMCGYYSLYFHLDVGVIRFFSLYGPHLRKQLLWDACLKFSAAGDGEVPFFGTGDETRDWLHVADAVSLMERFSESLHGFSVINGAGGKKTSIREVLALLAAKFQVDPGRIQFMRSAKPGDPLHCYADISQALALGWRPTVPLTRGIAEYAAWFKEAYA